MNKYILETDRLILYQLSPEDASFILELLNDDSYLRFIGDKQVRTLDDARNYILNGPMDSYQRFGFGLYLTKLKDDGTPVGICGLINREGLDDVDVGYAFLAKSRGKGYATEAARAILGYGKTVLGLQRIIAITLPDNYASINVLEKLGLCFEKMIILPGDSEECKLFMLDV